MNKYLKKMKNLMIEYLTEKYGKDIASEKWEQILQLNNKWINENGTLGGRKNMLAHYILMCYAVCAFYEVNDRECSQEEFDKLANVAMNFEFMKRFDMNKLEKRKTLMKIAYKYLNRYKKKADKYRGNKWGNTWEVEINPENREEGIAFTFRSCPLLEFAKKYNYMDIMPYMCKMDPYVASTFKSKLIRHNILADGDNCCEYWYVGDNTKVAKEDVGSK